MDRFKIYLFYFILTNVTSLFSNSYLYAEYNETFKVSKRLSINISFRDFGEFLLYAIDSDRNRLLITYSNKQININFNGFLFNKTVIYHPNSINNFEMLLKFENYHSKHKLENSDLFEGYPIPINYSTEKNKTYFWIGNIGPYIGEKNRKYEPLENGTFGCLYYLYVNFRSLNYENYGDYFSKSCVKVLNQINCVKENCSQKKVTENFINCSFHKVNANKNCYFDLIEYDGLERSFERMYDLMYESTSLKFIWQQKISKQICLVEIILKNRSSLLFYTNERNQLEMCFQRHLSDKCNTKILFNTTLNDTHVLLIAFEYPHTFIKISNGKYIRNIIEPFLGHLTKFVIGFKNQENICGKFEGKLAFRYDVSKFRFVCSQMAMFEYFKILFWIVLIFIGIALFLIAICIERCCCRRKANMKQKSINIYNVYEQGNIQERHLPTPPSPSSPSCPPLHPPPLPVPPQNYEKDDEVYAAVNKYEII